MDNRDIPVSLPSVFTVSKASGCSLAQEPSPGGRVGRVVCVFSGDSTITDSHNPISSIAMLCYVITVITSDYSDLLLIVKIVT